MNSSADSEQEHNLLALYEGTPGRLYRLLKLLRKTLLMDWYQSWWSLSEALCISLKTPTLWRTAETLIWMESDEEYHNKKSSEPIQSFPVYVCFMIKCLPTNTLIYLYMFIINTYVIVLICIILIKYNNINILYYIFVCILLLLMYTFFCFIYVYLHIVYIWPFLVFINVLNVLNWLVLLLCWTDQLRPAWMSSLFYASLLLMQVLCFSPAQ